MEETVADNQDNRPTEDKSDNNQSLENNLVDQQNEDVKDNTETLSIPEIINAVPIEETSNTQQDEKRISDQDIILRNTDNTETKPKWNQKCTVITLLSSDATNENDAYVSSEKKSTEAKTKKIPKVLTLCLGPGNDDSTIGTRSEKSKQDEAEESETCEDEADIKEMKTVSKNDSLKSKTVITMFKSKISDSLECSDQTSGDSETDVVDNNKLENMVKQLIDKNMDIKTFSQRTPKMLRRMFSRKRSSSLESADENEENIEGNSLINSTDPAPPVNLDSEEEEDADIELRKKQHSLKHTISVGFRNSFRLKRTLSEPSHKSEYKTISIQSVTIFQATTCKWQIYAIA